MVGSSHLGASSGRVLGSVLLVGMLAAASCATNAMASTAVFVWDASVNGGIFSPSVHADAGDMVKVRLRVSIANNSGSGSIPNGGGLAGFDFLPTLSNFQSGDSPLPLDVEQFATGSIANPVPLTTVNHPFLGTVDVYTGTLPIPGRHGAGVVIAGLGRQAPFAARGTNAEGVPTPNVDGGTLVWRSSVLGNAGVSIFQQPSNSSQLTVPIINDNGTVIDLSDDFLDVGFGSSFSNNSRSNVAVFSYSFVVDPSDLQFRSMSAGCSLLSPVLWYTSSSGAVAQSTDVSILPAAIEVNYLPTQGTSAALGFGLLIALRRRRRVARL